MIPVSIWFLVLMVFVGGFVAYAGDAIGRNVGKKRRSFGRLRPKHTAMVATFIAGMLGTLATIFILSTVSKPVQRWILEGDQVRRDLVKVQSELEEQRSKLGESRALATKLESELGSTNEQLKSAEARRTASQQQNRELQQKSRDLAGRVQNLGGRLNQLATTIQDYKKRSEELADLNQKAQLRYSKLTGDNTLIQEQNLILVAQAADLERKLAEANREYEALQKDRNDLQAALQSLNDKFDAQSTSYKQQIAEAEAQLATTSRALQTQREALQALENYAAVVEGKSGTARNNPIIFDAGDELARSEIPAIANSAEVGAAIDSLLTRARSVARSRGAVVSAEGSYAGLPYDRRQNKPVRSPEDQLSDLQKILIRQPKAQLLIAKSQFNAFVGDFVPFVIEVHEIRQIYSAGDVVLNIQLDGRKSVPAIVAEIADAMSNALPDKLRSDGLLPVTGSSEPFGSLSSEQVINLALEVKEYGRPLRMQLVAQEDTRNADRIKLTPRLRP